MDRRQPSFSATAPLKRLSSPLRVALALGLLVALALGSSTSCSSEPEPPKKEPCEGGVINPVTNKCEGKCTIDKCVENNLCSSNRCVLICDSHLDCFHDGTQDCAAALEDDTMYAFSACLSNGKPYGVGLSCPFGSECGTLGACANGAACNPAQCGGAPDTCVKDEAACQGQDPCTIGKCGDGTACTVNPCPAAECSTFTCISKGEGDADAYCSVPACSKDDDCAAGYYCGFARDPHAICDANPPKGDDIFCGKTVEDCIDKSLLTTETLKEGEKCILRKTCLKRSQCAPCSTNLDCSLLPSQECVSVGAEMVCARSCGSDKDCDADYMCDTGFCKPRFGSCVGKGNFCEPCRSDEDCAAPLVCFDTFNGAQKACVDLTPGACTSSAECPKSPGNMLNGACRNDGACLPPSTDAELSCW